MGLLLVFKKPYEFLVKLGFVNQVTTTILPWELFVESHHGIFKTA
jgi:hypothetical protein